MGQDFQLNSREDYWNYINKVYVKLERKYERSNPEKLDLYTEKLHQWFVKYKEVN